MSDRMRILIPTHKRINRQFTLRYLPPEWRKRTTLVATHGEAKPLKKAHPDMRIWEAPEHVKTIAQKRQWILEHANGLGIEKILMFDDDLRFSRRVFTDNPDGTWSFKLRMADEADIAWGLRKIEKMLGRFAHVGIGARQGNNGLKTRKRWNPNYRLMYALGLHVPTVMKECELGRIEHREDMDMCLQLLTKGYPNRVLIELTVDQVYNGVGGAREERKVEASNKDADLLASWFPDFVKVQQREYSQSIPRREVIVAWKKAYAYGVQRRKSRGRGRPHRKER